MSMQPCKGCGKQVLWAETVNGKKIPIDMAAPVYRIGFKGALTVAEKIESAGVSHFTTCKKANEFSASARRKPTPPKNRTIYEDGCPI